MLFMAKPIVDLKNGGGKGESADNAQANTASVSKPQELNWEAAEFSTPEKSRVWFGILFAGTVAVVGCMIWLQNYTAAVFFVLAGFMIYLYSTREAHRVHFAVTHGGVRVGGRLYAYEDLRSFWIFYEKGVRSELSLQSHKALMPYIRIPLGQTNPARVHALLSRYLPEQKHADSAIDAFSRSVGF